MTLSRNLSAALANSIWTALVGFAVVPLYLKYLGIEAYGVIGFFATIQALLSLLDLGLAPTINREIARCKATDSMREARNLLHTLTAVYLVTALVIALLVFGLSSFVADRWLRSSHLSALTLDRAIVLMGLVISCRWLLGLYHGALMGMERLAVSSYIGMIATTIGGFGAVLILAFLSPTIEALFVWQACVAIFYVMAMRRVVWDVVGRDGAGKFNIVGLKRIWRFSAGVSGVALSAILLTQLDKLILSKMLNLAEFGQYILATTLAGGLYVLITPVFNIIYPRFSALVASGATEKLAYTYRLWTSLFAVLFFPIAMVLAVFSEEVMLIWTGNPAIAAETALLIALLTSGSALHAMMYFPYALQLSYGMTKLPLLINSILAIVLIPLTIILTQSYGAKGGAIAWLLFHILYMLLGTYLTHRYLLKNIGFRWLLWDVGIPLFLSLIGGALILYLSRGNVGQNSLKIVYGGVVALLIPIVSIILQPNLRAAVCRAKNWKVKDKLTQTI